MNKIYVLVPIYNFGLFLDTCLKSIFLQTYKKYICILFDDGSTDNSIDICNIYTKKYPDKFKYLKLSNENNGPAYSKYNGINFVKNICTKEDIFMIIDGDDYLINPYAFSIIVNTYINKKCWATFGSYIGKFSGYQKNVNMTKYSRKIWHYAPPRSCKCFLLKLFTEDDFKYKDNTWLKKATDLAFFCNIIEWSGIEKVQFIKTVIYKYREHSNNVHQKKTKLLSDHVSYVKSKNKKQKYIL
jgi:glycosyltransferase involved in cell wall biosynthesis